MSNYPPNQYGGDNYGQQGQGYYPPQQGYGGPPPQGYYPPQVSTTRMQHRDSATLHSVLSNLKRLPTDDANTRNDLAAATRLRPAAIWSTPASIRPAGLPSPLQPAAPAGPVPWRSRLRPSPRPRPLALPAAAAIPGRRERLILRLRTGPVPAGIPSRPWRS